MWKDITTAAIVYEHWTREQSQNARGYCQQSFNGDRSCCHLCEVAFCEVTASYQPLCRMCSGLQSSRRSHTVRQPGLAPVQRQIARDLTHFRLGFADKDRKVSYWIIWRCRQCVLWTNSDILWACATTVLTWETRSIIKPQRTYSQWIVANKKYWTRLFNYAV